MISTEFRIGHVSVVLQSNTHFRQKNLDLEPFQYTLGDATCSICYNYVSEDSFKKIVAEKNDFTKNVDGENTKSGMTEVYTSDSLFVSKDFLRNRCEIYTCSDLCVENVEKDKLYYPAESSVIANLSYLVSQFSIDQNGLILHGAGLVRNDHAYIFLAEDEGGKTTLINRNSHFHVLGDDQIFFTVLDSGIVQADATPFGTITDGPAPSFVKGFFLIRKSQQHEIRQADNLNLLSSFMSDNSQVFNSLPKERKKKAFELLHGIAFGASVFELKTNYGHIDWDYLDRCVEKAESNKKAAAVAGA